MRFHLSLPVCAVALFCLTSMAGCPNNVPAGQLNEVKGRVVNGRTGQPIAGVRIALVSKETYPGHYTEADSTWTDLQGTYRLSFVNTYGLFYGVSCEAAEEYDYGRPFRLDLPDSTIFSGPQGATSSSSQNLRTLGLTIGGVAHKSFRPSPRRVFAVRVITRRTGYQQLRFAWLPSYPAD